MFLVKRIVLIIAVLVLIPLFLSSQQLSARIVGKVTDTEGNALFDVFVKATHINNGEVTTTKSNKKGNFRLLSLAPGEYQVSFDLEGFQSCVISGVKLLAEQSITLRPKLKKKESAESES